MHHITGPRTMRLITEFISLWNIVARVQRLPVVPDTFRWRDVRWFFYTAWGEVDLEDVGASACQVFLLAGHAWVLLDGA